MLYFPDYSNVIFSGNSAGAFNQSQIANEHAANFQKKMYSK